MTKPVIVTRAGKGSALTWTEGDTNLTNLRDATITVTDGTNSKAIDLNGTITFTAGTNVTLSVDSGTGAVTINSTASGGGDVVNDTTPQLGGNLDVNGYAIVSANNGHIDVTPNGSGNIRLTPTSGHIVLGAVDFPTSTPTTGQVLYAVNSGGQLGWTTPASGGDVVNDTTPQLGGNLDVNGYSITSSNNGNINISPNGSGNIQLTPASGHVTISAVDFPTSTPSTGQILYAVNGTGTLGWTTPASGGYPQITDDTSTNATRYILFDDATSGDASSIGVSSTKLTYNPSTGVLTSTSFSGSLSGNASSASYASAVTLTADNTTNATNYPLFSANATGNESPRTDTGFTYNPSTGVLTSTSFAGALNGTVGVTTPNSGKFTSLEFKNPLEPIYNLGTTGGTIAPDPGNGSVQKITLNAALTINGFTNATAGESLTLIIYGGTAYTSITSTMKFAGGIKTLTATAGCIDILSIYYDGTTYFASLGKGYA